jgi:WD40 repeat protein
VVSESAFANSADVELWDVASAKKMSTVKAETRNSAFDPQCLSLSPNAKLLATISASGARGQCVRVWDTADGKCVATLADQRGDLPVIVLFSPDGKDLITVDSRGLLQRYDANTWAQRDSWSVSQQIQILAFSPKGNRLAIGTRSSGELNDSNRVELWDAEKKTLIGVLKGHYGKVDCLTFSPDGRTLAAGGTDQTVRLWDTETGQYLVTLTGPRTPIVSLAFRPDGEELAALAYGGFVHVWHGPAKEIRRSEAASTLVESLYDQLLLKNDVVNRLRVDTNLEESTRFLALKFAERHPGKTADELNNRSWLTLHKPGADADVYRRALALAEAACVQEPDNWAYLNTLGVAQYRCGLYREAVETLRRSDQLNTRRTGRSEPADLAFLAMAAQRLGQADEAKMYLERLRAVMKGARLDQGENRVFLQEAEALLKGNP